MREGEILLFMNSKHWNLPNVLPTHFNVLENSEVGDLDHLLIIESLSSVLLLPSLCPLNVIFKIFMFG